MVRKIIGMVILGWGVKKMISIFQKHVQKNPVRDYSLVEKDNNVSLRMSLGMRTNTKLKGMMDVSAKFVAVLLFGILLASCIRQNPYPIEPYIEFVSFEIMDDGTGQDNTGILTISYTDGDGDLGNLDAKDSTTNYYIIYQEMQHGVYVTPEEYIDNFSASLPRFVSSDKKQPIDGTIQRTLDFYGRPSNFDTIRFECWLVDRAKHESNHIFTPEIILKK